MRHMPTILRQVRRSSKQAGLFVLCVALSLATLTALSGFAGSVSRALHDDARTLHAADIVIGSYEPISAPLAQAIERLSDLGRIVRADVHEFYTVVRTPDGQASVLSRLRVVAPGYPFYGEVVLKSGRSLAQVLVPGTCIVEQALLDRTGLTVGDPLSVGYTTVTIIDVVTAEPDRSLELFALGPRVLIGSADLDALGLMASGSRIRYGVLIKVPDQRQVDAIAIELRQASAYEGEQVDTFLTAGSAVKRFMDNFLFFLKLVGLFILMVSGLGIQSTLMALFNEKQHTIAVMKTVGATRGFITTHFVLLVFLLGAAGIAMGFLAGTLLQVLLTSVFAPFLPENVKLAISWRGVTEAVLLGVVVVALFSFLPLQRLNEMRPLAIFNRQASGGGKRWPFIFSVALCLFFFLALVLWHMRDIRFGLYFFGAVTTMVLVASLTAQVSLWAIKRMSVGSLALRQAIRGLFRRGNATRATVITLTVSLAVIFGGLLIEQNLNATFVRSFPVDSPNAFFIDIQPGQTDAFSAAIGRPVTFFPIVRARITAVNGEPVDRQREDQKRQDNLSRVFNLTYREELLDDETLIQGNTLFRSDWAEPQVSVMDSVVAMREMKIGDYISFTIQGVALTARISSIRTRDGQSLSPFFYFVFPGSVLGQAPHTLFAALTVAPDEIGSLQNQVVARFPNISVIDMSQTIGAFARIMVRLSRILRLFSFLSMAAGILILVSAVFATRAERMAEAVYYKILGAGRRFIFSVFALENLLLGLLSGGLALVMAQAGAYWVCAEKLDIAYRPLIQMSLGMVGLSVALVVVVGMMASRSIMAKRPVTYLREQQNG